MEIPESVEVGPYRYDVVYSVAEMDTYNGQAATRYGAVTCYRELRFILSGRDNIGRTRQRLTHEVTHAICDAYDLDDKEVDERFVETFSSAWLDTLRRNPRLTQFLTELSEPKVD
jgi:hypothetical protein